MYGSGVALAAIIGLESVMDRNDQWGEDMGEYERMGYLSTEISAAEIAITIPFLFIWDIVLLPVDVILSAVTGF